LPKHPDWERRTKNRKGRNKIEEETRVYGLISELPKPKVRSRAEGGQGRTAVGEKGKKKGGHENRL